MEASPPLPDEPQNQLSALVVEMSNGVKGMMENMHKMITEINENSDVIEEEIEKYKDSALQRKRTLDEEKEHFQKAAYAVLDMLSKSD